MEDVKRGPGRPPKEREVPFDELPEEEQILLTYADGKFDAGVCAAVNLTKEEFDERMKKDDVFKRLISFGRMVCQAKWEDAYNEARKGNGKLNASMINFAMKNMFGWAEKTETTNSDLLAIEGLTRDEALTEIRRLLPGITDIAEARAKKA